MITQSLPRLAPLSLLLIACDPSPAPRDDPQQDRDGDGVVASADCDDQDASASPRAVERCDRVDNDCDGIIDDDPLDGNLYYGDADGDGYGSVQYARRLCQGEDGYAERPGDCDDADAAVSPAAEERCDRVDNDCDGSADEPAAVDAPIWYLDQDGDGYGNPYVSTPACSAPEDHVAVGEDCDDADPDRSPAELELCDDAELDEDCDLLANDEDTPINPEFWFRDADGDGHGDPGDAVAACAAPPGYVGPDDDCDDADDTCHGAAAERCGDGLDNDCDGAADEEGVALSWYADGDGDGYGDPDARLEERCAAPEAASTLPTDCEDADPAVHPGAEEIWYDGVDGDCDGGSDFDADGDGVSAEGALDCDDADPTVSPDLPEVCGSGLDEDCDGDVDPCDRLLALGTRGEGEHLGAALAALRDLDGDGVGELAVAAPREDGTADEAGLVAVLRAGGEGEALASHALWRLSGAEAGDRAGEALAGADLDGDGLLDLAVGAPGSDAGLDGAGALYALLSFDYGATSLSEAEGVWTGLQAGDGVGAALASAGDADGDGYGDLLVGAPQAEDGAGAAWLVAGPASGALDLSWARTLLAGEEAGDQAGSALAGAFDVDGDGQPDALVGGPLAEEGGEVVGAAWLILDPPAGTLALADADARWRGPEGDGRAGAALAAVGDLDGDGLEDLAVSAPEAGTGGRVWLLTGGAPPSAGLDEGLASATLETTRAEAGLGAALLGLGDLDGDGLGELLVGAPGEDAAGSDAGAAWLLAGPLVGALVVELDAAARLDGDAGAGAGGALARVEDWDGDGLADLAVGGPASERTPDLGGAAWIWGLGGWDE